MVSATPITHVPGGEASNSLRTWEFRGYAPYSEWPQVTYAMIEAIVALISAIYKRTILSLRCGKVTNASAQFLAVCRRSKWSKHVTNLPFLALRATVGSNAAYKIISACSNAVS